MALIVSLYFVKWRKKRVLFVWDVLSTFLSFLFFFLFGTASSLHPWMPKSDKVGLWVSRWAHTRRKLFFSALTLLPLLIFLPHRAVIAVYVHCLIAALIALALWPHFSIVKPDTQSIFPLQSSFLLCFVTTIVSISRLSKPHLCVSVEPLSMHVFGMVSKLWWLLWKQFGSITTESEEEEWGGEGEKIGICIDLAAREIWPEFCEIAFYKLTDAFDGYSNPAHISSRAGKAPVGAIGRRIPNSCESHITESRTARLYCTLICVWVQGLETTSSDSNCKLIRSERPTSGVAFVMTLVYLYYKIRDANAGQLLW